MEQHQAIKTIPVNVWKQTLVHRYEFLVEHNLRRWRHYDDLLKRFCRLSSTSKLFNTQLNDKFFLEAIYGGNLTSLKPIYARRKIRNIIKNGSRKDMEALLELSKQYRGAYDSLRFALCRNVPLIGQYSDPDFMQLFKDYVELSSRIYLAAIRRANARSDNDMTLTILPKLMSMTWAHFHFQHKHGTKVKLEEALQAGKKLNFDSVLGFDTKCAMAPSDDLFLTLLDEQSVKMKLVIPEGKLLHLNRIGTKGEFKSEYTNMYKKKNLIVYRDRSKTIHEIGIGCETNDSNNTTFVYEDMKTDNLYELIIRTSLFEKIFKSYLFPFVAVTHEALNLPLEEQPWFFGNITDIEECILASEAPMHQSVFFTFSRGGKIYLVKAEAAEYQRKHNFYETSKTELHADSDLAKYFKKDKFFLGLYNEGQPKYLAEHYIYKYVLQGDFDKAQHIASVNDINWSLFKSPYLISEYMETTPKSKMNDKLLLWLIQQGAPLDETYERSSFNKPDGSFKIVKNVIDKCQDETISSILQATSRVSIEMVREIIWHKGSYPLLKVAYTRFKESNYTETYHPNPSVDEFLNAVAARKVKVDSYTNRTLIMMAWKYGNSENYFSTLPLELVTQILSYDDIDEPAYYDMLHFLSELVKDNVTYGSRSWSIEAVVLFLPFLGTYWERYFPWRDVLSFLQYISDAKLEDLKHAKHGPLLRYWFKRLLLSVSHIAEFPKTLITGVRLSVLAEWCLTTPTEEALELLTFLVRQRVVGREKLGRTTSWAWVVSDPGSWMAVPTGYLPTIKFLLDEDLLPETSSDGDDAKKLSDIYKNDPSLKHVKEFIENYRKEHKTDNKEPSLKHVKQFINTYHKK